MALGFAQATAVEALGDGAWRARAEPDWDAPLGPNGGYLAAIVVRAMAACLDAPDRVPRSVTLHYLRPPAHGELRIEVALERSGRNLSTLSARVLQADRLCVLALGAFSGAFPETVAFGDPPPPVPAAEDCRLFEPHPSMPAIAHRIEMRGALGALPFSGADEALTGGWMRLRDRAPLDAPVLALLTDVWLPASFAKLTEPVPVPTVDLTIHFRDPAAAGALGPEAQVLGVFRSRYAKDGFVEEDAELWSPDGVLLAHARQLAVFSPGRAG